MKKQIVLLFLLFAFTFCTQKPRTEAASQILPSDEIRMQYSQDNFYMPILYAVINDSMQFKVFFDTGVPSKYILASDSLKAVLIGDSVSVRIGKTCQQMGIDFMRSTGTSIFDIIGKNTLIVGWEFFENKILELSFENQYIRTYDSLPDISAYSKTAITISPSSHLIVPIQVVLQGKMMEDSVSIDTGNNRYASFATDLIEKYNIDTGNAYHGRAMTNVGPYSGFSLTVDTIKIGELFVTGEELRVGFRPKTRNRPAPGLLGVKTLENFSVILDLINFDLYLKPLSEKENFGK